MTIREFLSHLGIALTEDQIENGMVVSPDALIFADDTDWQYEPTHVYFANPESNRIHDQWLAAPDPRGSGAILFSTNETP